MTNTDDQPLKQVVERVARNRRRTTKLVITGTLAASEYYQMYLTKQPCHTSAFSGYDWVQELLHGHPRRIYDMLRMEKAVFLKLCEELVLRYALKISPKLGGLTVEESVAIFLHTLAHNMSNRQLQERYQHSGETISHHFHIVLDAMMHLAFDYIQPTNEQTNVHPKILANRRYHPFKDCIGALDGTHVACVPPPDKAIAYCSRKGGFTQNILAVCDFDHRFTFVSCGWEGSMHDSRVFKSVITNPNENFPYPIRDKFYLVDAGYENRRGYFAPYKGERMHMQQFTRGTGPSNPNELFNQVHSSLRCVIERTFGIWKHRWAILRDMRAYDYKVQVAVVGCSIALHNFILKYGGAEQSEFDTSRGVTQDDPSIPTAVDVNNDAETFLDLGHESDDDFDEGDLEMNTRRDAIRDILVRSQATRRR